MAEKKPHLISVIIPTYNRHDWVQNAIDSVLAQVGVSFECIVVDDGSLDGTGETLKSRYADAIRYVWQENQGESAARNHGVAIARGDFLAFLDSDDLWKPDKLSQQLQHLIQHPDLSAVYCLASGITAAGDPIPRRAYGAHLGKRINLKDVLKNGLPLGGSTLMIRRSAFEDIGGYDIAIRHGEDMDFCLRLLAHQYSVGVLKKPLTMIRSHAHSQSLSFDEQRFLAAYQDHLKINNNLLGVLQDNEIEALVYEAIVRQQLRMVLFYLYFNQPEQAAEYRRLIQQSDPDYLQRAEPYYHQIAFFTPHVYSIQNEQSDVLDFLEAALHERNANNAEQNQEKDSLLKIKTIVWCSIRGTGKDRDHALKIILTEIRLRPKILMRPQFWLQFSRLILSPLIAEFSKSDP